MLILRDVSSGIARFDALQKHLGIAPNILTRRLAALAESGLLDRRQYQERPSRFEYVLTERGRGYMGVLQVMAEWGRQEFGDDTVTGLIDRDTGQRIEPVVIDAVTGRKLSDMTIGIA